MIGSSTTRAARAALLALAGAVVSCVLPSCASSRAADLSPLEPGQKGVAIRCGRVLTVDEDDRVIERGLILVRDGRIAYVGPDRAIPDGYPVAEYPEAWAAPGLVELHSHIHGGDINDMVLPVNCDLRASSAVVPSNPAIKRACAGGVTTLFGIPGSGTSMGGFGIVYKAKTNATFESIVVRNPGGLKVAQSYNPERRRF